MDESQDFSAIIKVAQEAVKPVHLSLTDTNQLIYIPGRHNEEGRVIELDKYLAQPRRKSGTIKVFSVDAMNKVIFANQDAGDVVVYVDANAAAPKIIAVLNEHGPAGSGWRDFRCEVIFRPTVEWQKWTAIDGKLLPQTEFAEFIEENLSDIVDPPGAEMLEIVTYLQATRTTDFKSAINLSNGQVQFHNVESVDAKVKTGLITVPTQFELGISPIQGSATFRIPAKFRYRLIDGKLKLGLKLLRIEDVISQIFEIAERSIVQGDGITVLHGTP